MTTEDLKKLVGRNTIAYILQKIKVMKLELEKKIDSISQGSSGGELTPATTDKLGGIKAQPKGMNDTVPVKIGPDDILYVQNYPEVHMTQADKDKLDEFQSAGDYALKSDITTVYRYKGTLQDDTLLPENPEVGDTYNLTTSSVYGDGANVAWNGEVWDNLGATIDLSGYARKDEMQEIGNTEIDNIWNTVFGEEP